MKINRLYWVLISLLFIVTPILGQDFSPYPVHYASVGSDLIENAPPDIKSGSDLQKADYLFKKFNEILASNGNPLNDGLVDRGYYQLFKADPSRYSCVWHADAIENLFAGANIKGIGTIVARGKYENIPGITISDPNINHIVLYVKDNKDNKIKFYDSWMGAHMNGRSYETALDTDYGKGIGIEKYDQILKSQGYTRFGDQSDAAKWELGDFSLGKAYYSLASVPDIGNYLEKDNLKNSNDIKSKLHDQELKISVLKKEIKDLCNGDEKDEINQLIQELDNTFKEFKSEIDSFDEEDLNSTDESRSSNSEFLKSVDKLTQDVQSLNSKVSLVTCPTDCPNGSTLNKKTGECVCKAGFFLNEKGVCENMCDEKIQAFDEKTGECVAKLCPDGSKPKSDGTCVECKTGYFKNKSGDCQLLCPDGSKPKDDGSCPVTCAAGFFENEVGECESKCDEVTQKYDEKTGECIDKLCPDGNPIPPGGCLPSCAKDEYYDPSVEKCVKKCTTGGLVYDKESDGCVPPDCGSKKYWNANTERCECKSEYDLDESGNCVIPQDTPEPTPTPTYTPKPTYTQNLVTIRTQSQTQTYAVKPSATQTPSKGGMVQGLSSIEVFGIVLSYNSGDRMYHGSKDGDSIVFDASTFIIRDTTTGDEEQAGKSDILYPSTPEPTAPPSVPAVNPNAPGPSSGSDYCGCIPDAEGICFRDRWGADVPEATRAWFLKYHSIKDVGCCVPAIEAIQSTCRKCSTDPDYCQVMQKLQRIQN